ncbi:Cysteine protease [Rhodopirellula islandica]|uniref:Cysteine protease n=1 Tax=Rhodopirellula islandica TaxID=595434 RepID=A0A0J1BIV1_RHOIS|nr:C1 family peptidase [Rhodopirellula islandica]KLU06462.1 Cysteine protease [Rhodopirellula islandica]
MNLPFWPDSMRLCFLTALVGVALTAICQSKVAAQSADNPGVILMPKQIYEQIPTRTNLSPSTAASVPSAAIPGTATLNGVPVPASDRTAEPETHLAPPMSAAYSMAPGIDQNWGLTDSVVLPQQVDLRDHLPTPGKQAQNDCVAWAVAYSTYSCQISQERRRKPTFAGDHFSPEYVYDQISSNGEGLTVQRAIDFLKLNGCASRANLDQTNRQATPQAAVEANTFRLLENTRARNLDEIKLYLHEGYPVILVVRMETEFRSDENDGSPYLWSSDSSSEVNHHAVTAVGYDDQKRSLRLMNSWGTQWKDQGFCWASYDNFDSIDVSQWCAEAHVLRIKEHAPYEAWMVKVDSAAPVNPFAPPPPPIRRHFLLKNDRKVYENGQVISPSSWKVDDLVCNNKNLFLLARDQTVYQLEDTGVGASWSHLSRAPLAGKKVCMMAAADSQPLHALTEDQNLYQFQAASATWSLVSLSPNASKPIDLRTVNQKLRVITNKGTVYQRNTNGQWEERTRLAP